MNVLEDIPLAETVSDDRVWIKMTRLVEEVPLIDKNEQYYIRHQQQTVWKGRTPEEGIAWANQNNIKIELYEPFEP